MYMPCIERKPACIQLQHVLAQRTFVRQQISMRLDRDTRHLLTVCIYLSAAYFHLMLCENCRPKDEATHIYTILLYEDRTGKNNENVSMRTSVLSYSHDSHLFFLLFTFYFCFLHCCFAKHICVSSRSESRTQTLEILF